MRTLALLVMVLLLGSCGSNETATYQTSAISVSGEFLFEGPNTLQGPSSLELAEVAKNLNISADQIKAIYLSGAEITIVPDTLQGIVESALLQMVSDDLPLVSLGTKSPFPGTGVASLEVNLEQDILAYLKDPSATMVVDANLTGDADELSATIILNLNIAY